MRLNGPSRAAALALAFLLPLAAVAADYPKPVEGDVVLEGFSFHTGEVMPELRMHYTTVGAPTGQPVLVLHGTMGSGTGMLTPGFAGELFGAGQPLDAARYYIILPDSIGAGKSAKPSDGLHAKFPRYDYADAVEAQYRLLTEGLGIKHLRAIVGNSMGGMQAWLWAGAHPDFADAVVPMAAQPTAMASRNWMMRRLLIETIRRDPSYADGEYKEQPASMRLANAMFGIATAGGTLAYQRQAPTRALADTLVDERLAAPFHADANDYIWQWASSADFDAAPKLETISAAVLAINSADDERNPPQSGIMDAAMKRVKHGKLLLIPETDQTQGHLTTAFAKWYATPLREWLATVPERAAVSAR